MSMMADTTGIAHRVAYLVSTFAPHFIFALAALVLLFKRARARPLLLETNPHDLDKFDFVIVGGGPAGCALAARLSEHAHLRVLLIEAGQSSSTLQECTTPAAFLTTLDGPHVYSLYTEPQIHAENKRRFWPRARLLGGCTAINALIAQYGSASDYDECAMIVGDKSWSWKHFEKYFRKFENYTPDPRFPLVDASIRGSNGPVIVGHHAYSSQCSDLFVEAGVNAGLPFNPDFTTSRGTLGVNKTMTYIDSHGKRVSAETAYLTPEVLARPNLKVRTLTRVTKIIFDSSSGTPRAVAVEFTTSKHDAPFRVRALKEVIICGGSIHTPQILMLSGIGPSSVLKKHDIPMLVDSPGVGANLSDHLVVYLRFGDKLGITLDCFQPYDLMSKFKSFKAVSQYKIFGSGPFSGNLGEAAAFLRTDDQRLFPPGKYKNRIEDSTSSRNAPDVEVVFVPTLIPDPDRTHEPGLRGYTTPVVLLRPTSVGSIQLRSADPWDNPVIDPNYLATRHDVDAFVRGIRGAYQIVHTPPMTKVTDVGSSHPFLDHHIDRMNDEELISMIKRRADTLYHPYGTCAMGKDDNPTAVLDTQLRVRGTLGLRVCDASIYPKLIAGHTTASVYAAAEKLADILKTQYAATA